jgi:hypothetical protein
LGICGRIPLAYDDELNHLFAHDPAIISEKCIDCLGDCRKFTELAQASVPCSRRRKFAVHFIVRGLSSSFSGPLANGWPIKNLHPKQQQNRSPSKFPRVLAADDYGKSARTTKCVLGIGWFL